MEGFEEIAELLVRITGIKDHDLSVIHDIAVVKVIEKNDFLLQNGQFARYSYYVLAGVFREFYTDPKGREYNKAFCFKGDFTGSYYDLHSHQPSTVSIQALTDSKVIMIQYEKLQKIVQTDTFFLKLAHELAHDLLMKKLEKEYQMLSLSAGERYQLLRKQQPMLEQYVPAYHIASYLGITPVSFSRIRAQH